jgi:Fe2+ or Zn2+ uptake regulation protein
MNTIYNQLYIQIVYEILKSNPELILLSNIYVVLDKLEVVADIQEVEAGNQQVEEEVDILVVVEEEGLVDKLEED